MQKNHIEDILALTPMQQGMLFHYLKDPESDTYFEQLSLSLSGKIDIKRFEKSWNFVIQTNEMLRVVFRWEKVEHPVQIILKEYKLQPKYYDFSRNDNNKIEQAASESEKKTRLEEIKAKDRQKKFDLREVPFRVTLCKVEEDEYEMIISNHHILYDGWSNGIILKEFFSTYNNLSNGKDLVGPVKTKFREFLKWNQNRDIEKQKKFWRNYLKGVDTQIEVSIKQKRKGKEITKANMGHHQICFDREMKDKIDDFVKKHKITLSSLLYTTWGVLLQKYNNSDDVVFGTTLSGRNAKVQGIQDIVGLFINSVPLRIQSYPNEKIGDLLHRIDKSLQMREEYESASLVSIKEYSEIDNKEELFDTIIVIDNYPLHSRLMMGNTDSFLCFNSYSIVEMTHYDLAVGVDISSDIKITFYYKKDCFDEQVIINMANHFTNIVHELLKNPGKKIPEIEILSRKERIRLHEFNNTGTNYPIDKTVHEIFEERSETNPDHIAVVFEDEQITYGELNKRANRMARILRAKGVKNDSIVGLMLDRSINMMIGILGILKAGGAYLPIDKDYPKNRIISMLEDSRASLLLTSTAVVKKHSFTALQNIKTTVVTPHLTDLRPQIKGLDNLPIPDCSLVDYEKYSKGIGMAMARNTIAIQAIRGCPFKCLYCHKIWPKSHVARSAGHIFAEVRLYYGMGVRRFLFIDDIFNLNKENSARFFKLVIDNGLDIQMFFPNGMRGDLLTREYIDLMVEAGAVNIALALETASPRLQKLIGKNLDLDKLHKNMDYICKKYPQVISELFTMHGLPTETEEEAMMTLDFIKSMKWLHIPHVNILKIYPNTDMAKFALENGISMEDIINSESLAYHELPNTLPFDKKFTLKYQTDFTNEYFLLKERLLHVLPNQMKILTESEIVEKYNSFLPTTINSFADLLQIAGIDREELGGEDCLGEEYTAVPGLYKKMKKHFPAKKPFNNALRVMLLDLSQFFSSEAGILYDVIEPPLGLMYVMTYLQKQLGSKINGKIAKSRIDFDNYTELKALLDEFKPDVIGIRTLTYYKEFFHKTVAMILNWGFDVPIIAGGPYATSDYTRILQDGNIDLVVLGEGEITFNEIISEIFANNKKLPGDEILKKIPGIAFIPAKKDCYNELTREILMVDELTDILSKESGRNLEKINQSSDLAYVMYTSGSTGRSKGVMVTHKNAVRLVKNTDYVEFTPGTRVLQTGAPVFDATTFEIWGSLLNGGCLYLVDWQVILDANMLSKALVDNKINTLWLSSPLFNQLMQQNSDIFSSLKYLVVGGDVLSPLYINMVRSKNKALKVVNGYGPTENTTFSTCYLVDKDFEENIPIGKPIRNSTAYILGKHGYLQPIGVKGELCVGGDGVSRGYLNSPELTAEKFVEQVTGALTHVDRCRWKNNKRQRIYKTGDLARWLADGNIEFIGREDHQVKIRGFRVDPGEIETLFMKHVQIKEAVVLVKETKGEDGRSADNRDKFLCAYFVADKKIPVSQLREYLFRELPDYMVPAYMMQIDKIPLNLNGKIDKKELPDPEARGDKENYAAPRNNLEKKLVEIWAEVLSIEKKDIGIDDNFFELGGHSLKATVMLSKVHKMLGIKLPLQEIYENPEIRGLSRYIAQTHGDKYSSIGLAEEKEFYELSSAQKRLYVLQEMKPDGTSYNIPMTVVLEGNLDREKLEQVFRKLINRHESLRTSIEIVNEEPVQIIRDNVEFTLEYYQAEVEEEEGTIKNFIRPFDLSQSPLLRVGLIKLTLTPIAPGGHTSQADFF